LLPLDFERFICRRQRVQNLPLARQAGARQIATCPPTKKGHQMVSFSLAEKERFELSAVRVGANKENSLIVGTQKASF